MCSDSARGARSVPESRRITIDGLDLCLHEWAGEGVPVMLLHGWMDTGRAFAPLVDGLGGRHVIAPDWRGFGESEGSRSGRYYFPDYLADLDAIIDVVAGDTPVVLVGHSMGGNIACLYAGIRPGRVRSLVSLEGFGLPDARAEDAPGRYRRWLDSLRTSAESQVFSDGERLVEKLQRSHPTLPTETARFLARVWTTPDGTGRRIRGDPAHHRPNPVLYRLQEAMACWQAVQAPTLWVHGGRSEYASRVMALPDWPTRQRCFGSLTLRRVPEAGHMLHLEAPGEVALMVNDFLDGQ